MKVVKGVGLAETNIILSRLNKWPRESEQVFAKDFDYSLGSGPQITLIQLMSLGFKTGFATWFSEDAISNYCKDKYKEYGLENINIATEPIKSPININAIINTAWNKTIFSYDIADNIFKYDSKKLYDYLKDANYVIMQIGVDPNIYRRLKIEGKILLLDAGWSENLSFTTFREYIQMAHYFFPNRREAEKLTGLSDPKAQARILSTYYKKGIIKLGKDGVLGYDGQDVYTIPAIKEFRHIAQTGSGDSFLTGFIYGLSKDMSFKDAVLSGAITRGKFMSEKDACDVNFTARELDAYIARYRDTIVNIK
ncbi:MAG: carbohydrate kinase family protein [Christensenellales bacterium]